MKVAHKGQNLFHDLEACGFENKEREEEEDEDPKNTRSDDQRSQVHLKAMIIRFKKFVIISLHFTGVYVYFHFDIKNTTRFGTFSPWVESFSV